MVLGEFIYVNPRLEEWEGEMLLVILLYSCYLE